MKRIVFLVVLFVIGTNLAFADIDGGASGPGRSSGAIAARQLGHEIVKSLGDDLRNADTASLVALCKSKYLSSPVQRVVEEILAERYKAINTTDLTTMFLTDGSTKRLIAWVLIERSSVTLNELEKLYSTPNLESSIQSVLLSGMSNRLEGQSTAELIKFIDGKPFESEFVHVLAERVDCPPELLIKKVDILGEEVGYRVVEAVSKAVHQLGTPELEQMMGSLGSSWIRRRICVALADRSDISTTKVLEFIQQEGITHTPVYPLVDTVSLIEKLSKRPGLTVDQKIHLINWCDQITKY